MKTEDRCFSRCWPDEQMCRHSTHALALNLPLYAKKPSQNQPSDKIDSNVTEYQIKWEYKTVIYCILLKSPAL